MPRYFVYLRAINVGGHTVKMDVLRQLFESLKFKKVETFIASGNMVLETNSDNVSLLEKKIEIKLKESLGYEVATFIRTETELLALARHQSFPQSQLANAQALNVAFLKQSLNAPAKKKLAAFKTDIDDFSVNERELYWLCLKKQSESTFSNVRLEKALGIQATFRGMNTIRKMVEKYFA